MLGKYQVENYHPDCIQKLINYSNSLDYENLSEFDPEFLKSLAEKWPSKIFLISYLKSIDFIKNHKLMISVLKLKQRIKVQDTQNLVDILSEKLLLEPKVMEHYFKSLFLIKSKKLLAQNVENFIEKAALIGYSDFNIRKLLVALRVLYPNPVDLSNDVILNFLTLLALSSSYYKNYDSKSTNYLEKCLDLVEENYSGKNKMKLAIPGSKEPIEIDYFDKIPTEDKEYNKNLRLDEEWFNSFKKSYNTVIHGNKHTTDQSFNDFYFMGDSDDFIDKELNQAE